MISLCQRGLPLLALVAFAVAGCGGGGSSSTAVPAAPKSAGGKGAFALRLSMPAAPPNASPGVRKRFAFSASTQGVVIQVYLSPFSGTSQPVATGTFDVSPTSPNCTTNASDQSRSCNLSLPIDAGTYDLQVLNYDMAPVSGSIPGAAHQLGYGFLASNVVTAGASNSIALTVAGIASSVKVTLPVPFVRALESSSQYASVAVLDAAGSVILGSYIDSANNPVTVTMNDSTSSGLLSFTPSTFTSSLSTGVKVSYSATALTSTEMSGGATPTVQASLSTGPNSNSTLTVNTPLEHIPNPFSTGAPQDAAAGTDGSTGDDLGSVNVTTLASNTYSLQSTALAPTPHPVRIASGPDGRLWATAQHGSGIAAVTTSGVVSGYSVTFGNDPWGIASDGTNLWFTERNANKIGKMDTTGALVGEYPIPTSSSIPTEIALGSDGRMWFAETGVNKVGAIDSSGTISEYAPGLVAGASSVCSGPTGSNVWVTDKSSSRIASVTTGGSVQAYSVIGVQDTLYCTAGPDGNIWFVSDSATGFAIGRVVLPAATEIDVFPLPYAVLPTSIKAGSDGKIWVIDTAAGFIRVQI